MQKTRILTVICCAGIIATLALMVNAQTTFTPQATSKTTTTGVSSAETTTPDQLTPYGSLSDNLPGNYLMERGMPSQDPDMGSMLLKKLQELKAAEAQMDQQLMTRGGSPQQLLQLQREIAQLEMQLSRSGLPREMGMLESGMPRMMGVPGNMVSPSPSPSPSTTMQAGLPSNPQLLEQMKQEVLLELRNLQRMVALTPLQDPNRMTLQMRQADYSERLKAINQQLNMASSASDTNNLMGTGAVDQNRMMVGTPSNADVASWHQMMNETTGTLSDPNADRIKKLQTVAEQLRALGQLNAADQVQKDIDQLKAASVQQAMIPQGMIPQGAMAQPMPYNPANFNFASPWVQEPTKELVDLKNTVDSMRKEITSLRSEIKDLETQIRLLNRNAVNGAGLIRMEPVQNPEVIVSSETSPDVIQQIDDVNK